MVSAVYISFTAIYRLFRAFPYISVIISVSFHSNRLTSQYTDPRASRPSPQPPWPPWELQRLRAILASRQCYGKNAPIVVRNTSITRPKINQFEQLKHQNTCNFSQQFKYDTITDLNQESVML